MPPEDADFSFTIDFKKGAGDPRRVFDAASELIAGFEALDPVRFLTCVLRTSECPGRRRSCRLALRLRMPSIVPLWGRDLV